MNRKKIFEWLVSAILVYLVGASENVMKIQEVRQRSILKYNTEQGKKIIDTNYTFKKIAKETCFFCLGFN